MEENIEGLGGEDIFVHEDHRPTGLIGTWEFCKDYKESGNFQIGVLVSPSDLELLDLNISPLEVVENAERRSAGDHDRFSSIGIPPGIHARLPTILLLFGQALTMGSSTHCLRSRRSSPVILNSPQTQRGSSVKKRCCRFLPPQRATEAL